MSKRIGILMGGPSSESDISIKSGKAVYSALMSKGLDAVEVCLDRSQDINGYKDLVKDRIRSLGIDVAFIAMHGEFGEDGFIQSILEDMKIPYTGSKVKASQVGMDKIMSKEVFKTCNIPVPRHIILSKTDIDKTADQKVYFNELGLPLVIKPYNKGSSIGLYIVDKEEEFYPFLEKAFNYSNTVMLEEYIKGREITVGILADRPLPIVEIVPKNKFFDFEAKYNKGLTEYIVPAKMQEKIYKECQNIALLTHKALGADFFSRVDMILSDDTPVVLEINTIPGLTETSLLPKAAKASGMDFEELAIKILESAKW
ncbi:MAG: D-alanine--D-alanine ligase [Candidatus Omnitrophota bacterium]